MKEIRKEAYPVILKLINDTEVILSKLTGSKITLEMKVGEDLATIEQVNAMMLQQMICNAMNIRWVDICSPDRHRSIVDARKLYSYLAITILGHSTLRVAADIRRDHTTVMYLRDACKDLIAANDPSIKGYYEVLKRKLYESIN